MRNFALYWVLLKDSLDTRPLCTKYMVLWKFAEKYWENFGVDKDIFPVYCKRLGFFENIWQYEIITININKAETYEPTENWFSKVLTPFESNGFTIKYFNNHCFGKKDQFTGFPCRDWSTICLEFLTIVCQVSDNNCFLPKYEVHSRFYTEESWKTDKCKLFSQW